jgi:hypothetical protein
MIDLELALRSRLGWEVSAEGCYQAIEIVLDLRVDSPFFCLRVVPQVVRLMNRPVPISCNECQITD